MSFPKVEAICVFERRRLREKRVLMWPQLLEMASSMSRNFSGQLAAEIQTFSRKFLNEIFSARVSKLDFV